MHCRQRLLYSQVLWTVTLLSLIIFLRTTAPAQSAAPQHFTVLYAFKGTPDGANPIGSLIRDNSGTLYGTTSKGGSTGRGSIFTVDALGRGSIIHSFSDDDDGFNPMAGLTPDIDGNLYGTTDDGGTHFFWGTLFKVDKSGNHVVMLNFGEVEGGAPQSRLIHDAEGNLYGGTYVGGNLICILNGCGLVFKMDLLGNYSVLHYFTGYDGWGPNELFRDADGTIYGTTQLGGLPDLLTCCGVIYKLNLANRYTILYSFSGGADGSGPQSGLIRDAEGNFYGNTFGGGLYGYGVVYKLDKRGKLTVLHHFSGGSDGGNPEGGLTWGNDGLIYGTTLNGSAYGYGVIFRIARTGSNFSVLHRFTGTDGTHPYGRLYRGPDGTMYGTARQGGVYNTACDTTGCGTVFRYRP